MLKVTSSLARHLSGKLAQPRASWRLLILALLVAGQINTYATQSVILAWDANTDSVTTGYFVHTEDSVGNPLSQSDVGANTSATVSGLVEGNTYAFYVTAHDAVGNVSAPSNKVSKQVIAVPLADNKTTTTQQGKSVPVILSGSDSNGLPLTFSVSTAPAHGSLSGAAPNLSYTPASTFYGTDSFTYVAFNGTYYSTPATVTISVTPYAPTANGGSVQTSVNKSIALALTGSDPNGLPLTYLVTGNPAHGSLSGTAPNPTYTPAASFYGTDSFTFVVNNGYANSTTATVTISVVATPPTADAKSLQAFVNKSAGVTLSGTDPNGLPLTYRVTTIPAHGSLSGTAPNLTYTPANNYYGSDSFAYVVNDGPFDSAPATVSISVQASAPTANAVSIQTMANQAVAVTLSGTDPNGFPLTYQVTGNPAHGSLSGTAPNLTYTPAANYYGSDSFTYVVNDGLFTSLPATASITVNPNTPVANNLSVATIQGTAVSFTLTGQSPDGRPLTYVVATQPASGTLSGTAPNLTYTPSGNTSGTDSFTFVVNDGVLTSAPATVSVSVAKSTGGVKVRRR
jgi:hypothetical protein